MKLNVMPLLTWSCHFSPILYFVDNLNKTPRQQDLLHDRKELCLQNIQKLLRETETLVFILVFHQRRQVY